MTRLHTAAAAAALSLGLSSPALAQELSFSGGATLTSNYFARGVTFSNNRSALQFSVEAGISGFYVGAWASNVDFGTNDTAELNLSAGYRFSVGGAEIDIGYVRYVYNGVTGNCCGEAYVAVSTEAGPATLFAAIYYDPAARRTTDLNAGISYSFGGPVSASLTLGRNQAAAANYAILGVGYAVTDNLSLAADYHWTRVPGSSNRLVVSASFSF